VRETIAENAGRLLASGRVHVRHRDEVRIAALVDGDTGRWVVVCDPEGRWVCSCPAWKGDTPGCTTEACEFRDEYSRFRQRGAVVLGVSPDDEASHVRFKEKYSLPFTLLADPEHRVAEDYGVWVEKNSYGKKRMGIKRSTFVIDADGKVARAMYGVKPEGHADEVLEALPG
jgi:thioredoxin-dependent peroxiredoxin